MEQATRICNFIFHWTGVWAVMTYGTVAVVTAYRAVRRELRMRKALRSARCVWAESESGADKRPDDSGAESGDAES